MIFGNRMLIYDEMCRLTKASPKSRTTAQLPEDVVNHHTEVYSYDPVGNRLTGPKSTDSYTYDSGNEQLTYKGKLLLLDTGDQNEYDVNGNLIKKTQTLQGKWKIITTYAYDDENRLIKVTIQRGDHIKAVTFTYDHFGRRISKTVEREELDDDNNIIDKLLNKLNCPRTTYYIYDEQNIIAEYDDNGKQTATYIHGPNIDEPLAAEIRNSRIYYHADGLGSITTLTNHMGYKVQQYDYDSFGNIKSTPFWIKQPYTYTGREFDYETGLYYYRARYYDPKAGRFITKDPIGFEGGINKYAYVSNNPIRHTDPTGEIQACKRRWDIPWLGWFFAILPVRHCYIILDSGRTLSFDMRGTHGDSLPNSITATCDTVDANKDNCLEDKICNDNCLINAMSSCRNYNIAKNNCCDCVRNSLRKCNCEVPSFITIPWDMY
jgi:RHS repeat-associated protein